MLRYFEHEFKKEEYQTKEKLDELVEKTGVPLSIIEILQKHILSDYNRYLSKEISTGSVCDLYTQGLSLSEIGVLKNITKMGVRHHIDNPDDLVMRRTKLASKNNRIAFRNKVFYEEVVKDLTPETYEQTRKELGYSPSYFRMLVGNVRRSEKNR